MTDKVRKSSETVHFQVRNAFQSFLNFLLPSVCASCGQIGSLFCESCLERVEWLDAPVYSGRMRDGIRPLSQVWAAAKFTGPIPDLIHNLKYNGYFALAKPLAALMMTTWSTIQPPPSIDVIMPIPLHHEREKRRGYNQSALLADEMGCRLAIEVDVEALRRVRHTRPQVGLDARARQVNVNNAFGVNAQRVVGKRVLLIDDVFTTGATMLAAAHALHAVGAAVVFGYCVARAE